MGKAKKPGGGGKRSARGGVKSRHPTGALRSPGMEKAMAHIAKVMQTRNFASLEEANAFFEREFAGMSLDEFAASGAVSPLEEAQTVMYEAWDAESPTDRVELAEEALRISRDCADAYMLLAEEKARSQAEILLYIEGAVRAGERALGPKVFEEDAGHFWGMIETRPYMRARAALAECLWELGDLKGAIDHYWALLDLNPDDNQGIRYSLLSCLLESQELEQVGKLISRYENDSAASWQFDRALWAFQRFGESQEADALLADALKQNQHVAAYLLGRKKVPVHIPDMIGWGDKSEAEAYAVRGVALWKRVLGAREWLSRISQRTKKEGRKQ